MATLTVFTPAYNRAHTLPRTYESLLAQDCKDFIWLIVDDGSSDNTADMVRSWQEKENGFEIRYIYKENGGMHTAHNTAYENIDTELNVCIDSDDCMAPGAVEKILCKWDSVREKDYAGIVALDADMDGNIIGKDFPEGLTETTLMDYYAAGGSGDKKLVYRTDVIRAYPPYPVFEGERYVCISSLYTLIDQDYLLAVLPDVVCNVDYQPDGHSTSMFREYMRSPRGFAYLRAMCMPLRVRKSEMFRDCIHYVSSSLFARNPRFIRESPKKFMTILAVPFGILLNIYIRRKAKGN